MLRQFAGPSDNRSRRGFTLVELLVVIAIIGVLVGLLLPAVQAARERARSAQCINNLHQLITALTLHEVAHKAFPPGLPNCNSPGDHYKVGGVSYGAFCQGPNWAVAILPYMEERPLFDNVVKCMEYKGNACDDCSKDDSNNVKRWVGVGRTTPSIFICPSAPLIETTFNLNSPTLNLPSPQPPSTLAKGNYAGNFGTHNYQSGSMPFRAGAFSVVDISSPSLNLSAHDRSLFGKWKLASNKGTRNADFTDGTTKTIMVSEVLGFPMATDGRGAWTWSGMGGSSYTGGGIPQDRDGSGGTPNSLAIDNIPICGYTSTASNVWPELCTEETDAPSDPIRGGVYTSARSAHSAGGVHVATAGGSTHFIIDSIDPVVWIALHSRNGLPSEDKTGIPQD